MAKKKGRIPQYGTITLKGTEYYRTRILDADGKQVSLYALTCEELYQKELEASQAVADFLTLIKPHPVVTLLYASKEPVYNHARILRDYLEMHLKE